MADKIEQIAPNPESQVLKPPGPNTPPGLQPSESLSPATSKPGASTVGRTDSHQANGVDPDAIEEIGSGTTIGPAAQSDPTPDQTQTLTLPTEEANIDHIRNSLYNGCRRLHRQGYRMYLYRDLVCFRSKKHSIVWGWRVKGIKDGRRKLSSICKPLHEFTNPVTLCGNPYSPPFRPLTWTYWATATLMCDDGAKYLLIYDPCTRAVALPLIDRAPFPRHFDKYLNPAQIKLVERMAQKHDLREVWINRTVIAIGQDPLTATMDWIAHIMSVGNQRYTPQPLEDDDDPGFERQVMQLDSNSRPDAVDYLSKAKMRKFKNYPRRTPPSSQIN